MKPIIFEVWGQCARCNDMFSVYLHQRRHRETHTYILEPSPHLELNQRKQVIHLHNECGGHVNLYGFLP